ncbi:hypothetical protein F5887DRAFT_652760 [Amanita rubescens]|nr:hypothetical protein F5887DRAFT_652760 [Amanita rubescens]
MAPKEPTRAQLSSRLTYSQHTPAFLRRLQNKYSGNRSYNDGDEEDEEQGRYRDDPEFEDYDRGSGRPPIPCRPSIPERPPDDPGSADEDDEDEKPQIVVLKEGKHLTEREAENIRRKAKGLSPLPDPTTPESTEAVAQSKSEEGSSGIKSKSKKPPLMFSTGNPTAKQSAAKRKLDIVSRSSDNEEQDVDERIKDKDSSKKSKTLPSSKKQKKNAKTGPKTKTLLSFGDDA